MEKKYKLLENEIIKIKDDSDNLRTLYRIEALVDIRDDVPTGSKGGFIEKEDNLSQFGECWVFDDAKVFDNARVCEDAIVYDSAVVMDNAICSGISQIYGNANVSGFAEIRNDARIFENAIVNGYAVVDSHARVYGVSTVGGMSTVTDVAQVFDESSIKCGYISKDAQVGGSVIIDGNTIIGDSGIIKSPNDLINISGIGANCETMTAYRTKDGTTNVIYGGGFIGGLGEFTKYISDPTIFGDNTTEELKTILKMVLTHMSTDFSNDIIQVENSSLDEDTDYSDNLFDNPNDWEDDDINYDALDDEFESLVGSLVGENEESMAEDLDNYEDE